MSVGSDLPKKSIKKGSTFPTVKEVWAESLINLFLQIVKYSWMTGNYVYTPNLGLFTHIFFFGRVSLLS